MTSTPTKTNRVGTSRGPGLAALLLLISALVIGFGVGPAQAHAELEGSTPADGAVLAAAPRTIELVFGEDIIEAGLQVVAQDASGAAMPLTKATAAGPKVSVAWPTTAAAGSYRVSYRVTSQDGHPIDGTISFSYRAASSSASASAAQGGTAASATNARTAASPTAATAANQSTPTTASASPSPTPAAADGRSQWWIIAILVVLGVIIGAVIARVLNQRRAKDS